MKGADSALTRSTSGMGDSVSWRGRRRGPWAALLLVVPLMTGCGAHQSASEHAADLPQAEDRRLTLGVVQSQIKKGMSGAEVADILGAPNIVTSADIAGEAWIYDRVSTESAYSRSERENFGAAVGYTSTFAGVNIGHSKAEAGAAATTQRILTVVIRFGPDKRVDDVKYHASSF